MRLPGTEQWSDEDIEAALAFSDNARVATLLLGNEVSERRLPGGAVVASAWSPTDLIYELGDAAALAFATGRLRDGVQVAASLFRLEGPPPALTLMQSIFAATLGAIVNTVDVQLFEDEVTIAPFGRRGFVTILLSEHSLAEQQRLADLIIPAAFASPSYLDDVHALQRGSFEPLSRSTPIDAYARFSPLVRLARDWKRDLRMDQTLLTGRLLDYEGYIETIQQDGQAWAEMEFRGPLIDWPLLAMLVGVHRQMQTPPESDIVVGPATRFLQDLARELAIFRQLAAQ